MHNIGDIGPATNWQEALTGIDAIIHLAARAHVMAETDKDPLASYRHINRDGTRQLAKAAADAGIPLFGVCLGHQSIGQAFGGKIVRAPAPMHGKVSAVSHTNHAMFKDIPSPVIVTRYHSLIVERESLPDTLEVTAEADGGLIMALAHKSLPITGVQFHPESIASQFGHRVLRNFLVMTGLDAPDIPDRSIAA